MFIKVLFGLMAFLAVVVLVVPSIRRHFTLPRLTKVKSDVYFAALDTVGDMTPVDDGEKPYALMYKDHFGRTRLMAVRWPSRHIYYVCKNWIPASCTEKVETTTPQQTSK